MLISELITLLQKAEQEHGNQKITFLDVDTDDVYNIEEGAIPVIDTVDGVTEVRINIEGNID